ncbi:ACP S-malonyltransferase [Compostimonas suwonensis]|uniref:[acyl-carrier-protein] S-malonyltransferase n=1 Tax=Compostimonas suwonensis TaxID=1048394 RepID=A0A2M9BYZ3_9MICO|nr:ACP S-malonyltransferase [Compostimonas suwonensis]PJJ63304.1 [acyl-carrier-protein] S-malonyltransferase [Compostimonas suwonensis]
MIVIVCPGQGSQTPGFLEPWLADEASRSLVEQFSDAAGLDLIAHGTVSDADTIRDTAVAQPLIVAAGLLTLQRLLEGVPRETVGGIAGHSVGEITAAAGAGILSPDDAMQFVSERAVAMAQAAAATPTGMSAVLGGEPDEVVAHVGELGLQPANYNGGGQIVVAGELQPLARLADEPLPGTRVIPLQVAGAFHTTYMQPARDWLAAASADFTPSDPTLTIWTNKDGRVVDSGAEFVELLVGQVANPVRWDLCMESFAAAGVTGIIELAPAGALVGLARRGLKGVPSVAIKTPDDLSAARDLLAQQA